MSNLLSSIKPEDYGLNEDITETAPVSTLFCICCLKKGIPFISCLTCLHTDFLNSLMMPEIKLQNQVICYECHEKLKKIKLFRLQVEESFKLLSEISTENTPKCSNQKHNLKIHQVFKIDIPQTNFNNIENPQTILEDANMNLNDIIIEEKEIYDNTENSPPPKSLQNRSMKNIEEAMRIINNNQNSDCITFLANSLQSISHSLISDIHTNFGLGAQNDINPIDRLINVNTAPTTTVNPTENITNDVLNENLNTIETSENIDEEEIDRIGTENVDTVETVANEELDQAATETEFKDVAESNDMQTEDTLVPFTPIGKPTLGTNIKQLTLTREQLMQERKKIATSPSYLRAPHRCESCLIGFQFQENLVDHVKRKHTSGCFPKLYKMPTFCIVLTKENSSQLISLVPSTWVKDNVLFWPISRKNSDLELLRRDANSMPAENWKKIKCKVKLNGIDTFAEGLKLKELYSNFEETEDEERYHKNRENNGKNPASKSIGEGLLNLNSDFETTEDKENKKNYDSEYVMNKTTMNENDSNKYFHHASTRDTTINDTEAIGTDASKIITTNENFTTIPETENQNGENLVNLSLNELKQIIAESSGLQAENKILKESILKFQNLKEETESGFRTIQVQLDKLYDMLKCKPSDIEILRAAGPAGTSVSTKFDDEIAQRNIEFPINSIKTLDLLEDQLVETEFEKVLVNNFSRICGMSGTLKISKIGLQLTRCLFTDELLYQLTWKGIKGCTKVPFINYIKIRSLFFKIIHLADSCCSAKDSDAFLQNSAIKHSGQRVKRKSSDVKINNLKKKKMVTEKETTTENEDPSTNDLETIHDDTPDTKNRWIKIENSDSTL